MAAGFSSKRSGTSKGEVDVVVVAGVLDVDVLDGIDRGGSVGMLCFTSRSSRIVWTYTVFCLTRHATATMQQTIKQITMMVIVMSARMLSFCSSITTLFTHFGRHGRFGMDLLTAVNDVDKSG